MLNEKVEFKTFHVMRNGYD